MKSLSLELECMRCSACCPQCWPACCAQWPLAFVSVRDQCAQKLSKLKIASQTPRGNENYLPQVKRGDHLDACPGSATRRKQYWADLKSPSDCRSTRCKFVCLAWAVDYKCYSFEAPCHSDAAFANRFGHLSRSAMDISKIELRRTAWNTTVHDMPMLAARVRTALRSLAL